MMITRQQKRAEQDAIDVAATALYDKLNPNWEREILVSKDECIKRVTGDRRYRPRPEPPGRPLAGLALEHFKRRIEDRKLIRAAFLLVRHDPKERAVRDNLLGALSGRAEITETLLETAQQIVRSASLMAR